MDGVRVLLQITEDGVRIAAEPKAGSAIGSANTRITFRTLRKGSRICRKPSWTANWSARKPGSTPGRPLRNPPTGHDGHPRRQPEKAIAIQTDQSAQLMFVAFDVLEISGRGRDPEATPGTTLAHGSGRPHRCPPVRGIRGDIHREQEGDPRAARRGRKGRDRVKKLDQPYFPGTRASHWLKRKRDRGGGDGIGSSKLGTADRGHAHLVEPSSSTVPRTRPEP